MEAGKKLHERIEQELYVGQPIFAAPDSEINPYKSKSGYATSGYTPTSAYETFLKRGYANAPAWMKETPIKEVKLWDEANGDPAKDLALTKKFLSGKGPKDLGKEAADRLLEKVLKDRENFNEAVTDLAWDIANKNTMDKEKKKKEEDDDEWLILNQVL